MSGARLHFPAAHPAFAGHFPGAPMVPGALLLAEALAALGLARAGLEIAAAKFLHPVGPDAVVEARCDAPAAGAARLELRSGGRLVATATLRPAASAGPAAWRRKPERSQRWVLRLMAWIALRLGRRAARAVLHLITPYFLAFAPAARRASGAYLARALGRRATLADQYRHFHAFAATVLDRVYLLHDRFELFELEVRGEAELLAQLRAGGGALLYGAHLGSFEALRALGRRNPGLRVAMVMYQDNARMLNETLAAISPQARQDVIALGNLDSMLRVRDCLAGGGAAGVLGDRGLGGEESLELPFLGAPARFPLGPMRMAAMLRCRVYFMAGLYLGGRRYAMHFEPLADFRAAPLAPEAALAAYVACVERHCRAAPYNWFNFYDFWDHGAQS